MPLFNTRNLDGWEGQIKNYWSVKDGVIVGRNTQENAPKASTYLVTKKKYRNFRLIFEGKLATSEMHSGISLWGEKTEKEMDPFSYTGHLVMFPSNWGYWDLYRRNSIYKDDGRAKAAGRQPRLEPDGDPGHRQPRSPRLERKAGGRLDGSETRTLPARAHRPALHSNKVAQEVQFRGLVVSEDPEDRLITVAP
jgi:hypothetical protein